MLKQCSLSMFVGETSLVFRWHKGMLSFRCKSIIHISSNRLTFVLLFCWWCLIMVWFSDQLSFRRICFEDGALAYASYQLSSPPYRSWKPVLLSPFKQPLFTQSVVNPPLPELQQSVPTSQGAGLGFCISYICILLRMVLVRITNTTFKGHIPGKDHFKLVI